MTFDHKQMLADREAGTQGEEAAIEWNTRPAPKVKALEWEKLDDNCFRAWLPIFGNVRVENYIGDYWLCNWSVPGYSATFSPGHFGDEQEAKAAAQADYERRIRSALEE